VRWQQADFVDHSGETAGSIGTAGETEHADSIVLTICLHQELVGVTDVHTESTADCHVQSSIEAIG